jgi:DNA (cytosine-5)-methyltransferase 1
VNAPTIGSLFSGAGGLDMAVEAATGGRTAWHAELNPAACQVLAHRWPDVPNLGDITAVDWADVPPVSILCGGFPCQDVSSAGRRAGIAEGTRSGLWAVFADAIAALEPQLVVIENVRGLLHAAAHRPMELEPDGLGDRDAKPVLRAIGAVLGDLCDLGYNAQWSLVSAASVGAPHRRERVFIVATRISADAPSQRLGQLDDGTGRDSARRSGQREPLGGDRSRVAADAARNGRDQGRAQSAGEFGRPHVAERGDRALTECPNCAAPPRGPGACWYCGETPETTPALLPTPAAADGERGQDYARANREGSGGDDLVTAAVKASNADQWGKYAPAIERWEALTRPAPPPTELNRNGKPRLNPAFSEWMLGWPLGHVTGVPGISRNDQLRIVGNGVCPQQAYAALGLLFAIAEVAA